MSIDFPLWAVCAMAYGDYSGCSEEDESQLNEWLDDNWSVNHVAEYSEESYFCSYPEFGLSCKCIKMKVTVFES